MRLKPTPRPRAEGTIALINVVFLMLIFFLVAGQIAAPIDRDVQLVGADMTSARMPDDALVLHADGTTTWRGAATDPESFAAAQAETDSNAPLRILPDREVPARDLVALALALRAAGAQDVRLVTERSVQQ